MNKSKNMENNIFMWATKELSQDAVVAWLLANNGIGKAFVKSLLGDNCPDNFDNKCEIIDVETQRNSIDVLVTLKFDDEYQAIIIEDKTNTFLHNNQMLKYIEKVSKMKCEYEENKKVKKKKYSKIYFVLFKTGVIYSWEEKEFERQIELLNRKTLSAEELNDYFPETKLIISGSFNKNGIDISMCGAEISTPTIYNKENFKEFLYKKEFSDKNEKESEYYIFKEIVNYVREYKEDDSLIKSKEKVYSGIARYFEKKKEFTLKPIIPTGSGKRDYDICIYNNKYIKYTAKNQLTIPETKSDNFLVLPFIRFKTDSNGDLKLEFSVNYNIISNLEKLHGYQPFAEMKKAFNNNLEWYSKAQDNLRTMFKNDEGKRVNYKKDNQLKFISWDVNPQKEGLENNIDTLLNYANKIAEYLGDKKTD